MLKKTIIFFLVICLSGCFYKTNVKKEENIKEQINQIKKQDINLFGNMIELNDNYLKEDPYNFNLNNIESKIIMVSGIYNDSTQFIMVLPKKGKESAVKLMVDDYFERYEKLLPEEQIENKKLVSNRKYITINKHLIYIISYDNDETIKQIKEILK